MVSRKIEDFHEKLLSKLLSSLECIRPVPESPFTSSSSEVAEEEKEPVVEEEQVPLTIPQEYEEIIPELEAIPEPEIFPSPSLRRVLPDSTRRIEESNRIHTLPEEFITNNIDPQSIPKIIYTAQQKYIDVLADLVGCKRYKSSLAEFWFLDTLANLLRRAQSDDLDRPTQVILIQWFCEWMKEMQHFDAADRDRMLRRFEDTMSSAARFIATENRIPSPAEAGVFYKAPDDMSMSMNFLAPSQYTSTGSNKPLADKQTGDKPSVTFEAYNCSLRDLTKIIHYIYDLISNDYQYDLIRTVFTMSPDYMLIDPPYQIQNPKRLYAPLKAKSKKEKPPKKDAKGGKGKKGKEIETEEFLALMELKARDERLLDEQEDRDREDWNLRSHILPLGFAATDEFFDHYWPPPTPEPEPEPEPEPKGKQKGKGKK